MSLPGLLPTVTVRESQQFLSRAAIAKRPTGLVLSVVLALSLVALSILVGSLAPADTPVGDLVSDLLGFIAIWVAIAAWLRWREVRPFSSIGFENRRSAGWRSARGALIGVLGMTVIVTVGVLTGALTVAPGEGGLIHWSALPFAVAAAATCLVQGGAEELLCRGLLLQTWARRVAWPVAVVAQAVIFASAHLLVPGFGPVAFVNITLIGVALGLWAVAEGSLWGVIAFHGAWNWAQSGLLGISDSSLDESNSLIITTRVDGASELIIGGQLGPETSMLTTAFAVAAIVLLLWFTRKIRRRTA
ncbi:MAG: CPBP family intramembrane glutamic endopeptidase [Rhodoglobus sp.]